MTILGEKLPPQIFKKDQRVILSSGGFGHMTVTVVSYEYEPTLKCWLVTVKDSTGFMLTVFESRLYFARS